MLNEQQHAFGRVLDLMEDAGCLPYVILIGSWAEFVYRESGLLADYAPNIRTMDIDFLIPICGGRFLQQILYLPRANTAFS